MNKTIPGSEARGLRFPARINPRWRRWSGAATLFGLVREQADVVHARGANFVHHLDHIAVLGATVALDENGLVQSVGDAVANLLGDLRNIGFVVAQVNVPAGGNANDHGVILVGIGHIIGIVDLRQIHRQPFVSMGVTTMKMISSTSMMSAIGMTFGAAIGAPT